MRMNRILTAVVALALTGSATFVATSSATAAAPDGTVAAAGVADAQPTANRAKPHREFNAKIVSKGPQKLIFRGKVKGEPTYDDKIVKVQRKTSKNGTWRFYAKDRTDADAIFKVRVGAPNNGRWYFRAMTEATKSYAKSYSATWYTYKF